MQSKSKNKLKFVGTYYAGYDQIQVFLREGDGGEFWFCPEDGALSRIKVGADQEIWRDVLSTLVHEIFEFLLTKHGFRYLHSELVRGDHDAYQFFFSHSKFSEICYYVACFLAACAPDIQKAWIKWNKKK